MHEHPGSSVAVLARAASAGRSITGECLRGLAARGLVTKDGAGHWRLTVDLAGEESAPSSAVAGGELTAAEPERSDPPTALREPWVKPLACYGRCQRHEFEVARYG
jgi:hypothetical protein